MGQLYYVMSRYSSRITCFDCSAVGPGMTDLSGAIQTVEWSAVRIISANRAGIALPLSEVCTLTSPSTSNQKSDVTLNSDPVDAVCHDATDTSVTGKRLPSSLAVGAVGR